MTLQEFRQAYLDYRERITNEKPDLEALSEEDQKKAIAWIVSLEAAEGMPTMPRPSIAELVTRMADRARRGKSYLGDSVYYEYDTTREMVRLTTENGLGPSNEIWLEAETIGALLIRLTRDFSNEKMVQVIEQAVRRRG